MNLGPAATYCREWYEVPENFQVFVRVNLCLVSVSWKLYDYKSKWLFQTKETPKIGYLDSSGLLDPYCLILDRADGPGLHCTSTSGWCALEHGPGVRATTWPSALKSSFTASPGARGVQLGTLRLDCLDTSSAVTLLNGGALNLQVEPHILHRISGPTPVTKYAFLSPPNIHAMAQSTLIPRLPKNSNLWW